MKTITYLAWRKNREQSFPDFRFYKEFKTFALQSELDYFVRNTHSHLWRPTIFSIIHNGLKDGTGFARTEFETKMSSWFSSNYVI